MFLYELGSTFFGSKVKFDVNTPAVNKHIKNIYAENDLDTN